MFYLYALSGPAAGSRWIVRESAVMGRDPECDIFVSDPAISRRHCMLKADGAALQFEDLGAHNATLVNGQILSEANLAAGDRIAVGASLFAVGESNLDAYDLSEASGLSTVSLSELRNVASSVEAGSGFYLQPHEDREAYAALFRLGYALNRAAAIDAVIEAARANVAQMFNTSDVQILRSTANGFAAWVTGKDESPTERDRQLAAQAVDTESGVIELSKRSPAASKSPSYSLAVPLTIGPRTIGAIIVHTPIAQKACDENDLRLLLAAAYLIAPVIAAHRQRTSPGAAPPDNGTYDFIGVSDAAKHIRDLIGQAADTGLNLLIEGETGTGKEVVARMCHARSHRAGGPFVIVNCAAIPRELVASELFGHEKGAFTGAAIKRIGRIEAADGGTLFLDEIGDLPHELQAQLLRVLDTRTFERVGSNDPQSSNFRIIAATNVDLQSAVDAQTFRADLYHRIAGLRIHIPPLRDRKDDIRALADYFVDRIQRDRPDAPAALTEDAVKLLMNYPWPGNARELWHCINTAAHLADGREITAQDLQRFSTMRAATHEPDPNGQSLATIERRHILAIIEHHQGNLKAAAKSLGISRTTLYKRLTDYGIQP